MSAISHVTDSALACGTSKQSEVFPGENEERRFNISFNMTYDGGFHQYRDSLSCHYEESFCGGGKWFHVWSESKNIGKEWVLLSGDVLKHHYYSYCAFIKRYESDCKAGDCRTEDHFKFVLSRANTERPRVITIAELLEHGVSITNYVVVEAE